MSITDNRNRETRSEWNDGITPAIDRTYDAAGRLLTLVNSASSLTYSYDNANRLLSETSLITADGPAKTIAYTYDTDGNRQTLTYPDGTVVTNSYSARNELTAISTVVSYQYDLAGNRARKTLGNGTTTGYAYDNASRLLSIVHSNATSQIARFDYALNAVGNRTSKTQVGTAGPAVRSESYSYDAIDQVTGAAYALDAVTNRTVSYQYDAVGNRQQVTDNGTNTAYTANALNQYSAVGLEAPTYDANGNLTGQSGWAYSYDAQNRLISAVGGSPSVAASFSYDARNRCIKRVINSVTTYLTYDGWSLLEERDAGDNLHAKYIHGATIDEIIVRYNGSPVWYHHDALGSTSALTDGTGAVVESYTYDVYGTVSIFDGSVIGLPTSVFGNRFAFTGREYLADLGLYDYRNRFYSPSLGRFLQTDPIGFSAGDVNLYRYAENSVIAISDPFGLQGGKERITPTYLEGIKDENTVRQILQDKFPNDSTRQKMELKKWQKGNLSRKSSFSGTKLKPKGFGARGVVKGVGYLDILLIILEAIYYESLPDSVPCIEGTGPGTECPCQCPDYYQTYPPYKDCTKVLVGKVVA